MKISGTSGSAKAGGAQGLSGARRSDSAGFSVAQTPAASGPEAVARAQSVGGMLGVGALLALQQVEDPLGRRRRAVNRAGRILDALDRLKLALLEGGASPASLEQLLIAVREERADIDDKSLQELLNQIETRAAVELAKLGKARAS